MDLRRPQRHQPGPPRIWRRYKQEVRLVAGLTRALPPNNLSEMTEDECAAHSVSIRTARHPEARGAPEQAGAPIVLPAKSERTNNGQEHDLLVVRQGRRGCGALLRQDISGQCGRRRSSRPKRLSGRPERRCADGGVQVAGTPCIGLNGGPVFQHNEAFSFQIATEDQEETDRYWNAIVGNGGQESACGWCKDKWGISWQITPRVLTDALAASGDAAKRAFEAMMPMKEIDVAAIQKAVRG